MPTEEVRALGDAAVDRGRSLPQAGTMLPRHVKGLLYKEWLAHRNLVVGFWAAWLACGPVLLLFHHPAWIFGLGLLYALLAAPAFAGLDAAEGSEEFAFSLPPTRAQIYIVRLALAGGNLLAMLAAGLLVIKLNLAQALWGLAVQSGFTEPFPAASGNWYALALCAPVALFAFSFPIAALARSRGGVSFSWLPGALVAGLIAGGGLICEWLIWKRVTSGISCPLLPALSAAGLFLGYQLYLRKEGVSRPVPVGGRSHWWVWLIVGIILLLFLAGSFILVSFQKVADYEPPAGHMERPAPVGRSSRSP